MIHQYTGQTGFNLNYQLKKVSINSNDCIIVTIQDSKIFQEDVKNFREELAKIYPNNKIIIKYADIECKSVDQTVFINDFIKQTLNANKELHLKNLNLAGYNFSIELEDTLLSSQIKIYRENELISDIEISHGEESLLTVNTYRNEQCINNTIQDVF